ncbi:Allatostatin-A receptor [Aphelenchoides fujianensis]|nr:Allatostatin-A receptor [Aphelenchoides fujianensis]
MLLPVVVAMCFIIVIGFIGNSIVLFVIASNRSLHDSTNILISSLAAADFLFLSFCVPFDGYLVHLDVRDVLLERLDSRAALLRALPAITSPTKLKSIRRGKGVILAIIGVWISSALINYPRLKNVGVIEYQYNGTIERYCVDHVPIANQQASVATVRAFFWGFNFLAYCLPLFCCSVFYGILLKVLYKDRLIISKSSQKMKKRCTKVVSALICCFGILWLPQNVRFFLQALSYPSMPFEDMNESALLVIQSAAQILAYSNSCINPLLYGLMSEKFRKNALSTLNRIRGCSKRRSSNDAYYKQTLFTRNLFDSKGDSRARSPKDSPEQRTLNDNRNPSVLEASSFVTNDGPSVCNGLKQSTVQRPLIPRPAVTVERDNSLSCPSPLLTMSAHRGLDRLFSFDHLVAVVLNLPSVSPVCSEVQSKASCPH